MTPTRKQHRDDSAEEATRKADERRRRRRCSARRRRPNSASAITHDDRRGSRPSRLATWARSVAGRTIISRVPANGEQRRTDQGDPAAVVDVDQTAELDGDAER